MAESVLAERGRWPLWLPVFLGVGIALYFALPAEPSVFWAAGFVLAAGAGLWLARGEKIAPLLVASCLLAVAVGFAATQWRSFRLAGPVIERNSGALMLEGIVVEVEVLPDGGGRLTLDRVSHDRDDVLTPLKARIKAKPGLSSAMVGDRVRVRAMLMPPPQPAMPGAFDFARFAWFRQFGAIGTALGPVEVTEPGAATGWRADLTTTINEIRHAITTRIMAVLPGDRGAVTAALTTGDQMPISAPMMQAYRDSGLAHILSISGLHITMAAGLVFVGLRTLLALFPLVALRYPIKKWAAALAIVFAGFYTLLAGSPVPAQRSFFMTGLVLLAVLLDRRALSMRLVAWAAVAILLWQPDELIGPSFQMSFAAVVAMIAAYESLTPRQTQWRAAHPGWLAAIGLYVFGTVVTTLIAGFATAVYGIYHFNRFAVWSVAANMIAVPLTGFWVMPWALVMFLLLPFGLEALALVPMGWGVEGVNWVAVWVASWPSSAVTLPILPLWAMVVFTLGGCWLCLWRGRWRWWGLVPMMAALASMAFARPPDLLVDGRGDGMAVRSADGTLLLNGKGGEDSQGYLEPPRRARGPRTLAQEKLVAGRAAALRRDRLPVAGGRPGGGSGQGRGEPGESLCRRRYRGKQRAPARDLPGRQGDRRPLRPLAPGAVCPVAGTGRGRDNRDGGGLARRPALGLASPSPQEGQNFSTGPSARAGGEEG
ncbi:DNA internalization-related competence protein ComEC/Rec2 [Paramagnetospirillum magnetotacticum MS-1]|uniref:DNA internalization-related competence protein ComEC/Rec2 n=1 Tax=Paramagnetospirillum magnetotacticum MS-1 TaxID=272627 RepID=A0A0C2UZY1_PARME|nr:ComEC/Rec2 family competence protein [Paramagnetospirillum magnetotacticum]KIL98391.1 DNA internalization-related competence protein ComEC/Rec2 [Paramagnetospirillum magnetotacticum MS-1]